MSTQLSVWLPALVTLAIFSLLYRENIYYRAVEHLLVGVGLAHSMVMGYKSIVDMAVNPMLQGKWYMIVPILLGFSLYLRWFKGLGFYSRSAVGFLMGVGTAVGLKGALQADLFGQIISTAKLPLTNMSNVVMVVGLVGTLMHFLFITTAQTGEAPMNPLSRVLLWIGSYVGRGMIMVALGSAFAYTIMARISVLIGRIQFLFRDWIYLIPK